MIGVAPEAKILSVRVILEDEQKYIGHYNTTARHTQQVDFFIYEHDMRTKEIPQGLRRAQEHGAPALAGSTA